MVTEQEHFCPRCGEERSFRKVARTTLHLGKKTKWACPECTYGFVQVDGVDTSTSTES